MKHVIKIEAINHGGRQLGSLFCAIADAVGIKEKNPFQVPWIAEITGRCSKYGMVRKFVKAHVDYSEANSKGTRGVMYYFPVNEGCLIEVFAMTSWRGRDRYFAIVQNGEVRRLTKEETGEWLDASNSASAS